MRIVVSPNGTSAGTVAAILYRPLIDEEIAGGRIPQTMLAVGRQQYSVYRQFNRMVRGGWEDFTRTFFCTQDDWVMRQNHPLTLRETAKRMLLNKIGVKPHQCRFPSPRNIRRYPEILAKRGGVFGLFIGIGRDSHFAFVRPGKRGCLGRPTKLRVTEKTRKADAPLFGHDINRVPREAVTIRFDTVRDAKNVILICASAKYINETEAALFGKVSTAAPCSLFRSLPDGQVTVVLSYRMAQLLRKRGHDVPEPIALAA